RLPNDVTAARLADAVDRTVVELGTEAEITLIGHSMGGLVARYYLESGRFSDRPGFDNVRRLVTLGTPHRGAPLALVRLLGHDRVVWLNPQQVHRALNDPRYPSAYHLLPAPGEMFAWDETSGSNLAGVDVYERKVAEELGLSWEGVQSAARFHAALDPA